MAMQVCVERMIITHPRRARRNRSVAQIEAQLEGARHRLLLLPEADALQLGSVISRLGALTAEARVTAPMIRWRAPAPNARC